jgi:hypothetical protein
MKILRCFFFILRVGGPRVDVDRELLSLIRRDCTEYSARGSLALVIPNWFGRRVVVGWSGSPSIDASTRDQYMLSLGARLQISGLA